jgi:energy-converting hydrogenase Eha subunit B
MALSSTLIKKVTKMNRAAQDVNLGYVLDNLITSASSAAGTLTASVTTLTAHMVTSGCVAVTPTEASASVCYILTGTSSIK